jgi:hypothetical protein
MAEFRALGHTTRMSRSYRTEPKRRIAARNANRDAEGRVLLPRIVERTPRLGDVHPIPKVMLAHMLSRLPVELYYGLRLIEMRPRQNSVGQPFGKYSCATKTIWLYSLPSTIHLRWLSPRQRWLMEVSKATIEERADGCTVSWRDSFSMGFWFYYDTFVHELGHHHRFQYPAKTGHPGRVSDEESMADRYCYWTAFGRLSPKKYGRADNLLKHDT